MWQNSTFIHETKKKTLKVSIKRMYLLTYQTTLYDKSTAMLYPKGEAEPFL